MQAACDGDVFRATNLVDDPIMLNIDSTAVVRNFDIFEHFLLNWKIWEKARRGVVEMLLATVEILVHSSHPHYKFNIEQFQKVQLVQRLLVGCQVRYFFHPVAVGKFELKSTLTATLFSRRVTNKGGGGARNKS